MSPSLVVEVPLWMPPAQLSVLAPAPFRFFTGVLVPRCLHRLKRCEQPSKRVSRSWSSSVPNRYWGRKKEMYKGSVASECNWALPMSRDVVVRCPLPVRSLISRLTRYWSPLARRPTRHSCPQAPASRWRHGGDYLLTKSHWQPGPMGSSLPVMSHMGPRPLFTLLHMVGKLRVPFMPI